MTLLEAASDPYEDLAHIGDLQLPKVRRIIRVRLMPDPEHGPGIGVREGASRIEWSHTPHRRYRESVRRAIEEGMEARSARG